MKLVEKPTIYRTIIATVEHNKSKYVVYAKENLTFTDYEIRELDEDDVEEPVEVTDARLRSKLVNFLEKELEDFELFN